MYGRRMSAVFSTSTTLRIYTNSQLCAPGDEEGLAYVDRPEAGSVTGGHVLVEGIDGLRPGHLAVLLVHVVGAGARIVTDPDTEVLDLLGALLVDLKDKSAVLGPRQRRLYIPGSQTRSHRWPS